MCVFKGMTGQFVNCPYEVGKTMDRLCNDMGERGMEKEGFTLT